MLTFNKINMHPHTSGQLETLIGRTVFQMFSEEVGGEGNSHQPVQLNTSVSIFRVDQPKETIEYMCVYIRTHVCIVYKICIRTCVYICTYVYIIMSIVHMYIYDCMCVHWYDSQVPLLVLID